MTEPLDLTPLFDYVVGLLAALRERDAEIARLNEEIRALVSERGAEE